VRGFPVLDGGTVAVSGGGIQQCRWNDVNLMAYCVDLNATQEQDVSFFKGKFDSLSNLVSDAVASSKDVLSDAKDKSIEYSQRVSDSAVDMYSTTRSTLTDVAESTANSTVVTVAKEKAIAIGDGTKVAYEKVSVSISSAYSSSSERAKSYASFSSEKVSAYFSKTMEIDKDTDQVVAEIKDKLPVRPKDVDHIFEQTKQEALRRAVSAFCLAPVVAGLDRSNELKYANLSQSYGEFAGDNWLHGNKNFSKLADERFETQERLKKFAGVPGAVEANRLENGYDPAQGKTLDPFSTDIEHIIPKKEIYQDMILRLATDDGEIIEAMNFSENLIFADQSLNRSKSDLDLVQYIKNRGTRDPDDSDRIMFIVGVDKKEVWISEKETLAKYEKAQEELAALRREAMKEIGLSVASAGARMAAQQVVGLIVTETVDIFVDEIKDVTQSGLITDKKGIMASLDERRMALANKLNARFEERQIMQRAKEAGIEGGIAGVLSSIPQILISMLVKLPALVLSIIRECTLSTVRCVRVMLSNLEDKYEKIGVILFGAATTVIGLYVATTLSKALMSVPLLNLFNHSVADVLSGVLVTAVPLAAIYVFDQNKSKFMFKRVHEEDVGLGAV